MPKFNYIASNAKGESSRGVLEAPSKSALAQKLQQKGLFLVHCRSDESETVAPRALPPRAEPLRLRRTSQHSLFFQRAGASAGSGS